MLAASGAAKAARAAKGVATGVRVARAAMPGVLVDGRAVHVLTLKETRMLNHFHERENNGTSIRFQLNFNRVSIGGAGIESWPSSRSTKSLNSTIGRPKIEK